MIEPLRTELSVERGTTTDGVITLTNERDVPVRMQVTFRDLSNYEGVPPEWIRIDTNIVELDPAESVAIPYTVRVPEQAVGEFRGRLAFEEPRDPSSAAITIGTRISVPIYVTIAGTEQFDIRIAALRFKSFDPAEAEVEVQNHGNVYLRAKGTCTVLRDGEDETLFEFPVNEQGFPVYAGGTRYLVARSPHGLAPGAYTVRVRMDVPGNPFPSLAYYAIDVPEPHFSEAQNPEVQP
jgi:hypothetical protein